MGPRNVRHRVASALGVSKCEVSEGVTVVLSLT
jgi:hypothetical protein